MSDTWPRATNAVTCRRSSKVFARARSSRCASTWTTRIEIPYVESKEYEYLYRDGNDYLVMDLQTYDQLPISTDVVGDAAPMAYSEPETDLQIHEGKIISLEVPFTVELTLPKLRRWSEDLRPRTR